MSDVAQDYRRRFRTCGANVTIHPDVVIEHPEVMAVGNDVHFMKGVIILGCPGEFTTGDHVSFWPYVFMQGSPGHYRFGDNVNVYPYNYFSGGGPNGFIEVGHTTHFAPGCKLYGGGGLSVGNDCAIAAGCLFSGVQHTITDPSRPMVRQPGRARRIILEDDVYLGANVVINGDVTVRQGCVIGAGAVVTKSTEPYGFYTGVPATLKRWRKPPT